MTTAQQQSFFSDNSAKNAGPVECLGLTFADDDARRAHFTELLRQKLQDPAFRNIEGFPLGEDEDILRMSDPPYYTACPNPFLAEFVTTYGQPYAPEKDQYHGQPFAVDTSEGKTDPIYAAHSYHTKVPFKAIVPAILYYTQPGDLVLDGFAGSGMTGVAAQMCGQPPTDFQHELELKWQANDNLPPLRWGARRVILNDLSPAATFIEANFNLPFEVKAFEREARRMLKALKKELGWMYETWHTDGKTRGQINYTVWSDIFACSNCGGEVVFVTEALDPKTKRVKDSFPCPHCNTELTKARMERLYETYLDPILGKAVKRLKRQPVLINYNASGQRLEKKPDEADLATLKRIESLPYQETVPTNEIPFMHMTHERARMEAFGITHIHHFYLPRQAQALGTLWAKAAAVEDTRTRQVLLFFVEQAISGMSLLNRYGPTHFSQVNRQLSGVYYVSSQISEVSPWYNLDGKLKRLVKAFQQYDASKNITAVTTGTVAHLHFPAQSIDYIFTDPPFGENIYYADLNYLVESWHRVWTDAQPEAIVDHAKGKKLLDYQHLMQQAFEEYYRVLKPGRWMTVVFHNSRNAVWNAIQEAMQAAGFIVADVRTLDKQQRSYRQVTSTAVKQDLVISAYKPNGGLEKRLKLEGGTEEGAWDFVRTHLRQLPVFVSKNGRVEVIAERLNFVLYDRMVAFHVQRGLTVPLSAVEFYAGLEQRFPRRDNMYFLPDQVVDYDQNRLVAEVEVEQLQFFVSDEESAIKWLRHELSNHPQTFQEIHPQFIRDIAGWIKNEKPLELTEILEQNFLRYEGQGPIPHQIWNWMGRDPELRRQMAGRSAENPVVTLQVEARHRWYVPDPNRAADLEKLRERALLKEFGEYHESKQKRLRVFRLEAVRAGFKKAWQERDYPTIIEVAEKIPDNVLQEDPKLLMWYDQAITRTEM